MQIGVLTTPLSEKGFGALVDFLGCQLFFVSREEPDMAERVFQSARAIAIKLVLHSSDGLRSRSDSLRK